jgi:hypothetical protein
MFPAIPENCWERRLAWVGLSKVSQAFIRSPVSLELGEEVVLARLAAEFEPAVTVDDQTKLGAAVCAPIFSLRHYALLQQFLGPRRAR